jgi:hypothetical protein
MLVKLRIYKSVELGLTATIDWEDRGRLSGFTARTRSKASKRRSQSQCSRGKDEKGVGEHGLCVDVGDRMQLSETPDYDNAFKEVKDGVDRV